MEKTFIFYQDPGHGWVKVPVKLLINIEIADKVSSFSYYRNGFAFLEEDNDAALFIHRMKEIGINPKFKESCTDRSSKIRNYNFYDKDLHKTVTK